jgi:hypothetical protein
MATIVIPGTDRLTVDAAQLAKHYAVEIAVCPPRRAQRKGVVEAAIKYLTRSWWRSAQVARMAEPQASLDLWCARVADGRRRRPARSASSAPPSRCARCHAPPTRRSPGLSARRRGRRWSPSRQRLQRPAGARRQDRHGPHPDRRAGLADPLRGGRDRRRPPALPGRGRADPAQPRARGRARAGGARRVHTDHRCRRKPLLIIDTLGCAPRGAIEPGGMRGPPPAAATAG